MPDSTKGIVEKIVRKSFDDRLTTEAEIEDLINHLIQSPKLQSEELAIENNEQDLNLVGHGQTWQDYASLLDLQEKLEQEQTSKTPDLEELKSSEKPRDQGEETWKFDSYWEQQQLQPFISSE
ncbi:MAG: hypothetical protein KJ923_05880, partial [Candidatus Omnitrophica bacterium]|nr:hypothetical protein [Candidatus Omnitrophota bacterium]